MVRSRLTSEEIQRLVAELIVPFYEVERDIPLPIASRRKENDAEHSWSVALFACALAPHIDPTLDIGKVCQFAIVHDLAELHAGDTSVFAADQYLNTKTEREAAALKRIEEAFAHIPWLTETLAAYERQDTPEAHFVKAIDKVLALWIDYLEGGGYYREHGLTKDFFLSRTAVLREKASMHKGALVYYDQIYHKILKNPGHFHKKTRDESV
jgi:5'-deoxynucleotidase YfbR-like HD superfamily hydrolase